MATVIITAGGWKPYTGPLVPAGTTATTTYQLNLTPESQVMGLVLVYNVTAAAGNVAIAASGVTASGYTYSLGSTVTISSITTVVVEINGSYFAASAGTGGGPYYYTRLVPSQIQVVSTVTTGATYGIDYILT